MHWKDLQAPDGRWLGLELEVARRELPDKPRWRLEYAPPGRVRLMAGRAVRLWARIDDWWEDWEALTNDGPAPAVIEPLHASTLRRMLGDPGSARWWRGWARELATRLAGSACTPLSPGRWRLSPVAADNKARGARPAPPRWSVPPLDTGPQRFTSFGEYTAVPTRVASRPDDARVKAWRKRARDGTLPPVLVLWLDPFDLFLVVDGHDRLLAATLEGTVPPCLALWPVERLTVPVDERRAQAVWAGLEAAMADPKRRKRISVASMNETLLQLYDPSYERSVPRAWRLRGGRLRWAREVRARLRSLGVEPDTAAILAPLTAPRRQRQRRAVPPAEG